MSGFQQNNQQWAYSDGQQSMQYHEQSTSWSSQNTSSGPPMLPPAQTPALPGFQHQQMLPAPSFHDQHSQMHSQMMAQAQQHHQMVSQSIQQSIQQSMQNMHSMFAPQPITPALPVPSGEWGQQQQLEWTQSEATPQQSFGQPLQLTAEEYEPEADDGVDLELERHQAGEAERRANEERQRAEDERRRKDDRKRRKEADRDRKAFEDLLEQNNKAMRDALAAQQAAHQESLRRQEEKFALEREDPEQRRRREAQAERERREAEDRERERDARLARMEGEARERKEREAADKKAKDREIEAPRRQLEHERQQKLEDERRHGSELAALAAKASQAVPSAQLDMSAMKRLIDEFRSQQLKETDIAKLIEATMSKQLQGVAKAGDLEISVERVQKALGKLPSFASAGDVQMAVTKGIDDVMQRAMAAQQQRQQGCIEASPAQQQAPRVQTTYTIEEVQTTYTIEEVPTGSKSAKSQSKTKALQAPASQPAADAHHIRSGGTRGGMPGCNQTVAKVKRPSSHSAPVLETKSAKSAAPTEAYALAKVKKSTESGKAASSSPVLRPEQSRPAPRQSGAPKMLTAIDTTGIPPYTTQTSSDARSIRSAQPTEANALAKIKKPATASSSSTPKPLGATSRPDESNPMVPQKPPTASGIAPAQRTGTQLGSSQAKQLTYSTEPGTETGQALVRQKKADGLKKPPR